MSKSLKSLSDRLKYILTKKEINQKSLAHQIGISPQAINYLCVSNAQSSRFTYEIAAALEINPEWLATGNGSIDLPKTSIEEYLESRTLISVYQWAQLPALAEKHFKLEHADSFTLETKEFKNCFGLIIADSAMSPALNIGSVAIVQPSTHAQENDYLLVYLTDFRDFFIRQMVKKHNNYLLTPINCSIFKEIPLDSNCQVLGTVVKSISFHKSIEKNRKRNP